MRVYVNLTAGLAALERFRTFFPDVEEYVFMYIRSSHLESKALSLFWRSIPDDLLLSLAIGRECIVLDGSSNHGGRSRVIRTGIPLILYALHKFWRGEDFKSKLVGIDYMERALSEMKKIDRRRFKYYKRFYLGGKIKLRGASVYLVNESFPHPSSRPIIIKDF